MNGYLQDWREYAGENAQSVQYLFTCLKQCRREDIVYEICNKFREGKYIVYQSRDNIWWRNLEIFARIFAGNLIEVFNFNCIIQKIPSNFLKYRNSLIVAITIQNYACAWIVDV